MALASTDVSVNEISGTEWKSPELASLEELVDGRHQEAIAVTVHKDSTMPQKMFSLIVFPTMKC